MKFNLLCFGVNTGVNIRRRITKECVFVFQLVTKILGLHILGFPHFAFFHYLHRVYRGFQIYDYAFQNFAIEISSLHNCGRSETRSHRSEIP